MTERKLFGTNLLVDNFTSQLTKIEDIEGGWSTRYLDERTNQYWLKYVVDDRGFFLNLILLSPPPTTDELINIAFTSQHADEVSAAAMRLCIEEQIEHKEYRQKLINRLLKCNMPNIEESERIKTIIQAGQLTDKVNRREISGKHYSEIQKDSDFFISIADNANEILESISIQS